MRTSSNTSQQARVARVHSASLTSFAIYTSPPLDTKAMFLRQIRPEAEIQSGDEEDPIKEVEGGAAWMQGMEGLFDPAAELKRAF